MTKIISLARRIDFDHTIAVLMFGIATSTATVFMDNNLSPVLATEATLESSVAVSEISPLAIESSDQSNSSGETL